jgi:hypothetical protein
VPGLLLGRRQRLDVGDDQRAGALVREHLGEDALGRLVGDHVHAAHAAADRVLDRLGLRQHAVGLMRRWSRSAPGPCRSVYEISDVGSSTSSRMPGAPVHSISFSAPSAAPIAAATVSALMFSSVPFSSAGQRAHDRHQPLSSSFAQHRRCRPGRCRRRSRSRRLARPSIFTGGRLCARIRPASTPLTPTASMSRSRQIASRRVLISPFSTIEVASMDFSSVTRRPCTMRVGTPSAR